MLDLLEGNLAVSFSYRPKQFHQVCSYGQLLGSPAFLRVGGKDYAVRKV